MLGAVVEEAFKDQFYVQLHSFPSPNGKSLCIDQFSGVPDID